MRFQSVAVQFSRIRPRHEHNPDPGFSALARISPNDAAADHLLLLSARDAFSMQGFR